LTKDPIYSYENKLKQLNFYLIFICLVREENIEKSKKKEKMNKKNDYIGI
jgi:hypothetical protein